jgi:hypothetical protein
VALTRSRLLVPGYFLRLELQKLLIGCLSGTFIYEFLKSLKVLSVYESIKILSVRESLHEGPPGQFGVCIAQQGSR